MWEWDGGCGLSRFGDGGSLRLDVFIEKESGEQNSLKKHTVFSPFMEAESSLPCSQKPITGSYPEPDELNSNFYFMFL
jgi:hypothetical protein